MDRLDNYFSRLSEVLEVTGKLTQTDLEYCKLLTKESNSANELTDQDHECRFYVNADWTGYSRCECGKEHREEIKNK